MSSVLTRRGDSTEIFTESADLSADCAGVFLPGVLAGPESSCRLQHVARELQQQHQQRQEEKEEEEEACVGKTRPEPAGGFV